MSMPDGYSEKGMAANGDSVSAANLKDAPASKTDVNKSDSKIVKEADEDEAWKQFSAFADSIPDDVGSKVNVVVENEAKEGTEDGGVEQDGGVGQSQGDKKSHGVGQGEGDRQVEGVGQDEEGRGVEESNTVLDEGGVSGLVDDSFGSEVEKQDEYAGRLIRITSKALGRGKRKRLSPSATERAVKESLCRVVSRRVDGGLSDVSPWD